jgi:DNA-directed RNA polymerase subunit H (RpoH/RPB5)
MTAASSADTVVQANLLKMLAARGYTVLATDSNNIIVTDKCIVLQERDHHINLQYIKSMIMMALGMGIDHLIVVYQEKFTTNVKTVVKDCSLTRIELFPRSAFKFCLADHYLVPRHERLTATDAAAIKASDIAHLPRLPATDAMAKYYDFQPGDFVKVTRSDGTSVVRRVVAQP